MSPPRQLALDELAVLVLVELLERRWTATSASLRALGGGVVEFGLRDHLVVVGVRKREQLVSPPRQLALDELAVLVLVELLEPRWTATSAPLRALGDDCVEFGLRDHLVVVGVRKREQLVSPPRQLAFDEFAVLVSVKLFETGRLSAGPLRAVAKSALLDGGLLGSARLCLRFGGQAEREAQGEGGDKVSCQTHWLGSFGCAFWSLQRARSANPSRSCASRGADRFLAANGVYDTGNWLA
ncbi:MAG: hypothetical protein MUF54_13935 [Polyangiaceae bacterium]|nr:hypothetical protein [Polyangiaceae bacterium]